MKTNFETLPFTNENNETLPLFEIIKHKKITSVTFSYAVDELIKMNGFFGLLGFKKQSQRKKDVTINGERINLHFPDNTFITFASKKEFEKIPDDGYNTSSLWKQDIASSRNRYVIYFCIENLKEINWV